QRLRPIEIVGREPYLRARTEALTELRADAEETKLMADSLRQQLLNEVGVGDRSFAQMLRETTEAGRLADRLAVWVDAPHDQRVEVLLELDVPTRLRRVIELVAKARASAELREAIDSE